MKKTKYQYLVIVKTTDDDGFAHDYITLVNSNDPVESTTLCDIALNSYGVQPGSFCLEGWDITTNIPVINLQGSR